MPNKKENLLVLFSVNESKIENLYKSYSLKFPSHRRLWNKLAVKKRYQAEILKDLSLRFDQDNFFNMNGYSLQILSYVSNFIDEQIKKLKLGKIFLQEALIVALRLERSLKEKESVEIFEPRHDDVVRTFKRLNQDTNQHVNLLIKAYNRVI